MFCPALARRHSEPTASSLIVILSPQLIVILSLRERSKNLSPRPEKNLLGIPNALRFDRGDASPRSA